MLRGHAKVVNEAGEDVTSPFIKGAMEAEMLVSCLDIKKAYMKSKSPSCGVGMIYRDNSLFAGNGVCAALLLQRNIELVSV